MFELTSNPIESGRLSVEMQRRAAGALVTFEGWVRDNNDGHAVIGLDYEAYESLALQVGNGILSEVATRHEVLAALCVHRIGRLSIGEVAVWVGVAAAHRDEAFAACRRIIDLVKRRVPIWKKEHYTDLPARWVACHDTDSG